MTAHPTAAWTAQQGGSYNADAYALAPGAKLGPYTISAHLGSGGMGIVYEAHDPRLGRQVAIKVLPPDLTRDETAKQRFLQEAKAASALDHPNICTIHEINETNDGQPYLVMAYYEGETLKQRIERGALPPAKAIDIATQVGQGLAKAHAAGIVHRDIKPANVIVTRDGAAKILDFGLAKLSGMEGATQTSTTVGTVAYMSPEQARGAAVDHCTDIWSLGVVLYEMLTGRPPFRGDNLLTLADAIRRHDPSPLTGDAGRLDRVVRRALGKEATGRYQDISDMLEALRNPTTSPAQPTTRPLKPSIAVLPFTNMSVAPELRGGGLELRPDEPDQGHRRVPGPGATMAKRSVVRGVHRSSVPLDADVATKGGIFHPRNHSTLEQRSDRPMKLAPTEPVGVRTAE